VSVNGSTLTSEIDKAFLHPLISSLSRENLD
jgi:hypothetical protein